MSDFTVWHLTRDAPRLPARVSAGEPVTLHIGTWPIEPGQSVEVVVEIRHADGTRETRQIAAAWDRNEGVNSYWRARLGVFARDDRVTYAVNGRSQRRSLATSIGDFRVGPKVYLAILWHQHQPLYKDSSGPSEKGSYLYPWVRLHGLRDYYSMAALAAEYPAVHLTINLTPSLLWQIEDYLEHEATDRHLELTLKPARRLDTAEREEVLATFFDADSQNQIFPHPRYRELFVRRLEGHRFRIEELRDLQMWSNLAWFGKEFRESEVRLATGEVASVRRFVAQQRNFTGDDIRTMVEMQYRILRAIVPLHRILQDRGQIEVSTTPFYHPILPILIDSDAATIDRPGATHPRRFAHAEDADAQIRLAVEFYRERFGRAPAGMWPAEGAVSQSAIPFFARHAIGWIATDRGVLARSGQSGYDVDDPDVLCRPYRAEDGSAVAVFFRDTALSDAIGFRYHAAADYDQAAREFLLEIKERFARRLVPDGDRVLTVALDGENAWGTYRDDGRSFLRALYALLTEDTEVETVTFHEYIGGNPGRHLEAHPVRDLPKVHDLFTGSWIDENGSAPGVDLGTWIGEEEENRAWELLGEARHFVASLPSERAGRAAAFDAIYAAEGSDWFWWFGDDQDSGHDEQFDDLFRMHLKNAYRRVGAEPPAELEQHIVRHTAVWTFTRQLSTAEHADLLTVRSNRPGVLNWWLDDAAPRSANLLPVGGVMSGTQRHQVTLGPFSPLARRLRFQFQCGHPDCDPREVCRRTQAHVVRLVTPRA